MSDVSIEQVASRIAAQAHQSGVRVVSIFGPTGSGKTDVAVRVAASLSTRVINADPAQCYAGLPILTNKPEPHHDAIAHHELVGIWPLSTYATVAQFSEVAHSAIDSVIAEAGVAVVAGGSGMYITAALAAMIFGDHESGAGAAARRAQLEQRYDEEGSAALHDELMQVDAMAGRAVHPHDRKRVVRALDVALSGGSIASGSIWDAPMRHASMSFGLTIDRDVIHRRINSRTQRMFEMGVLAEVAAVVGTQAQDLSRLSETSCKLHGLSDCMDILAGRISRDDGAERMAARTRQYAKRQDTWARRWPGLISVGTTPTP